MWSTVKVRLFKSAERPCTLEEVDLLEIDDDYALKLMLSSSNTALEGATLTYDSACTIYLTLPGAITALVNADCIVEVGVDFDDRNYRIWLRKKDEIIGDTIIKNSMGLNGILKERKIENTPENVDALKQEFFGHFGLRESENIVTWQRDNKVFAIIAIKVNSSLILAS